MVAGRQLQRLFGLAEQVLKEEAAGPMLARKGLPENDRREPREVTLADATEQGQAVFLVCEVVRVAVTKLVALLELGHAIM